jgi:hypothetical protein
MKIAGLAFVLLASAATAATTTQKVVFFGDQTTASLATSSQWNPAWVNLGVQTQETTAQELARFSQVLSQHPTVVHIIPGVADFQDVNTTNSSTWMPEYQSNVLAMINQAKNANIKVILGTLAPIYSGDEQSNPIIWGSLQGNDVRAVDAWLESYGAANNIPVENYHDLLCGLTPIFTSTWIYSYGCVGQFNSAQTLDGFLPYSFQNTNFGPVLTESGNQAIISMASTAIANLGQTLKYGYLSNIWGESSAPFAYQYNVNTITSSPDFPVHFVPIGIYSDGGTRPIVNTNFAGASGTWTSSNPNVMFIDQDGSAIAFQVGTTTITYAGPHGEHFSTWIMHVVAPTQ